jgi:hypothetical protein
MRGDLAAVVPDHQRVTVVNLEVATGGVEEQQVDLEVERLASDQNTSRSTSRRRR